MKFFKSSITTLVATTALLASAAAFAVKPSEQTTIVDAAYGINADSGEFSILLFAASLFPEIEAYLGGRGQRTLFAPTDDAFARLETNVLPGLCYGAVTDLPMEYIADVLMYHVAKGRKDSTEVLPADQIRMLTGDFVTREPGSLSITDGLGRVAEFQSVDSFADNGVIHVIKDVILPYAPVSNCD